MCQVPAPAATAYLVDLSSARGPRFVVLRVDDAQARDALVAHLVDIGAIGDGHDARELVADAPVESVGVVW